MGAFWLPSSLALSPSDSPHLPLSDAGPPLLPFEEDTPIVGHPLSRRRRPIRKPYECPSDLQ